MKTWRAGTSSRKRFKQFPSEPPSGFTLIELILVLFIVGLLFAAVFPKVSGLGRGDLKLSSRHLIRTVQLILDRSTSTKRLYRLHYDLDNQQYWASVLQEDGEFVPVDPTVLTRVTLSKPIRIEDVTTLRQGKVTEGEAYTQFYPTGMVEKTLLHLTKGDEDQVTLIVQPLTGRVKVMEGYIEEE
jgi:general secretion pathway protein H